MDSQSTSIDFALIGHQESWAQVQQFVQGLRNVDQLGELPAAAIKDVFSYIPPRAMFDFVMHSSTGRSVKGAYIETFISPDELNASHTVSNIKKVNEACHVAANMGANVVALGGFTSIVLELADSRMNKINDTCFTTGNTLTASFICAAVEAASSRFNKPLNECHLLVIGSTGDIGTACVNFLAGKVMGLLLCARQAGRLTKQSQSLHHKNISNLASTELQDLLPAADIIISVTSSQLNSWDVELLKPDVIICDAGYPKNINSLLPSNLSNRLFLGGMGQVLNGFTVSEDYANSFYKFPVPNVVHGCLLEAIVLSLDGCASSFSAGRGNITTEAMMKIKSMAAAHGIVPAPFFNHEKQWPHSQPKTVYYA